MKTILEKLNVHMMTQHYNIVGDLKLNNIILGLMQCSSRHACCYCKGKIKKDGTWESDAEPRTLENLIEDHEYWKKTSGLKDDLKEHFNVQHKPLLQAPNVKLLNNDFSETLTLTYCVFLLKKSLVVHSIIL